MELQEKFNDITKNLEEFGGFYYPKSAFGTEEIQQLLNYFIIEEIKMTSEIMGVSGEKPTIIDWTQEWYYMFGKKQPEAQAPVQPQAPIQAPVQPQAPLQPVLPPVNQGIQQNYQQVPVNPVQAQPETPAPSFTNFLLNR